MKIQPIALVRVKYITHIGFEKLTNLINGVVQRVPGLRAGVRPEGLHQDFF
jgi:hypothetical protein